MRRRNRRQLILALASAAGFSLGRLPMQACAQIDASWIGPAVFFNEPIFSAQPGPVNVLNQGHYWTDQPSWSAAPFPSQSGAATIGQPGTSSPVDRQARLVITLDADIALRELTLGNTSGVDITDEQPALRARLLTGDGQCRQVSG